MSTKKQGFLRRYTDIPSLIYLLSEQAITLLDPQSWDDRNDSYFLAVYRERKKLRSLLALCFSEGNETYHGWRVFAAGPAGVCISFDKSRLLKAIGRPGGLQARRVEYLRIKEAADLRVKDLPFSKRFPFEDEVEFRLIYESHKVEMGKLDIPVPMSAIDKITLSPWMHPDLADGVKEAIWSIAGCGELKVNRSTLISNAEWKALGDKAER